MNQSGFRGTPFTRLLIFGIVSASVLASLTGTKQRFHVQLRPHLVAYHQFARVALWQLMYANSGELLFAAAAFYNLRVVERMFGTRKFASLVLVAWAGTSVATVVLLALLNALLVGVPHPPPPPPPLAGGPGGAGAGDDYQIAGLPVPAGLASWGRGWNYLPPGPTAVVFALLAQYHAAVPSIYNIRFLSSSYSAPAPANTSTNDDGGSGDDDDSLTLPSSHSASSASASASSSSPTTTTAVAATTTTSSSSPTSSPTTPPLPPPPPSSPSPGITLTDKLPVYLLTAQLALSQPPGSLLAAAVGWVFGYAYRAELIPASRWRVPGWLFDRSGGEYESLRRRLAAGEFAQQQQAEDERGTMPTTATTTTTAAAQQQDQQQQQQRRPLMGQILDQFRGAF